MTDTNRLRDIREIMTAYRVAATGMWDFAEHKQLTVKVNRELRRLRSTIRVGDRT